MKKALSVLLLLLLMTVSVSAETDITISLNEELMVLEEPAVIVEGRTLIPVKFIFEPLGLDVSWNGETRTATGSKGDLKIDMVIDSTTAYVNGQAVELDVSATIINDRTYVPLRFVAESTGAVVTWHGEERHITIDYLMDKSYEVLFKDIYADVHDEDGPNMPIVREQYHDILNQLMKLKDMYLGSEESLKTDLIALAASGGLTLDSSLTMDQMFLQMHAYKQAQHDQLIADLESKYKVYEFQNGDQYYGDFYLNQMSGLGYYDFKSGGALLGQFKNNMRNGYLSEIYDSGYDYAFFEDDKASGMKFSYTGVPEGYILGTTYFDENGRQGISHQITFDHNNVKLHDAYYFYNDNESSELEYVIYKEGYELFDRGNIEKDVVLRIDPDGKINIAPTNSEGISDHLFTGFGFTRFENGVEYIGYFDDWSRLGKGMYYAKDDTSDTASNLVELQVEDILEELDLESASDVEKIKAIHDYLATHILYDPDPIAENDYKEISHTAYGALIDGVAVCDGYAEAFKYLLDKVGVENVLIFGEVDEEGDFTGEVNHAWNLIKVDETYKHYDLTWDDDDVNNRVLYEFYNKNSNFFDDTHRWEENDYQEYLN
ncbi:hypothetical protein EZV73_08330 [Acidaminobacter sp. JC074]|uniref:stalk domain-containing protein n=1 Tax=Acidaminobacter sp. JC074 TaxID=2530199 RepID=UPI001F107892|nr:stalk domain-containing protein [Acidaminobacter sp. JC074]MCH4887576.1 hypothetical protein [Acidaminobacter sp. JC074]